MPKVGKPKSKRVPVRLRHKIEKSSVAKQKKARKEAKKNPQWRSRLKKDPGIPNLFPYKAQVLAEIEEGRRKKEEEKERRREVARGQREGVSVGGGVAVAAGEDDEEDEELGDSQDDEEGDGEEMDGVQDSSNPMAALLASAQARAQTYTKEDDEEDEDDDEDSEDEQEWGGLGNETAKAPAAQPGRRKIPAQAREDPVKYVSALVERMQKTQDGIQKMMEHYSIPPLVTAKPTDFAPRFLVEVARKRGRLGRGGVPNLHAAGLIVLSDLNEERLKLPAIETKAQPAASAKGQVQIVQHVAPTFRIEGLWGDNDDAGDQMVVET